MWIRSLRKRLSYWFDYTMSKGTIAMTLLLLAATVALVGVIGLAAYFIADDGGVIYQLWYSLLNTLDPGNIANVPTDNLAYLLLMFFATLSGLCLTSLLIGIITTGVEGRLRELRRGVSVVQEVEHTVIIGFDENIYAILRELIEANANKKKACAVVLGTQPKDEMEDAIAAHIDDFKSTRVICRSGSLHEAYALERCAVESCRSVIINVHEDSETVKVMLALAAYVKGKTLKNPDVRFVAIMQDKQYVDAANIAGEGRAAIIYAKDAIARIIANTCRQHGLSQVFTELFNFRGDEIYFESVPELAGKSFREAMLSFSNAVAIGLYADGRVRLNPPKDMRIGAGDQIILVERDDGAYQYHPPREPDTAAVCSGESVSAKASRNLIVLGSNDKLPILLREYAKYVDQDARVLLVDEDIDEDKLGAYENLNLTVCREPITRDLLCRVLDAETDNILLLNDDSCDAETSDSKILLRLILLRDIAEKFDLRFSITTEMRCADNQRLASSSNVDDFVIGTNFSSLMLTQISEDARMLPLMDELVDERGSELYMKPVSAYVKIGVGVDSYTLTESAARKGEVYLGYRKNGSGRRKVIVNPPKDAVIVFEEGDQIVVVAER